MSQAQWWWVVGVRRPEDSAPGQTVTWCPKGSGGLDSTCEKKGNVQGDSSIFGLSHWKDGAAIA